MTRDSCLRIDFFGHGRHGLFCRQTPGSILRGGGVEQHRVITHDLQRLPRDLHGQIKQRLGQGLVRPDLNKMAVPGIRDGSQSERRENLGVRRCLAQQSGRSDARANLLPLLVRDVDNFDASVQLLIQP